MKKTDIASPDPTPPPPASWPDLWWLIQIYFVISFYICTDEIYHDRIATGAIELVAVGLAYAGPAAFIAAIRSRNAHRHTKLRLAFYAALAALSGAAAIWLMLWSDFRIEFFNHTIEGLHWVIAGIVITFLAGRKESW